MSVKYKIFVSANQRELRAERRAVKDYVLGDALLSEYFDVFLFEDAPARSRSAETAYLEEVRKSDIYIGILGEKYGGTGKDKISPTEAEFQEAGKKHKNILIYIQGDNIRDKKRERGIQELIKKIQNSKRGFSYKRFSDIPELTRRVYASLIEFLKEEGIVGRGAFDERVCKKAKFTDIDEERIRWFLKVARDVRKFPLDQKASVKDVLTHLKLLKDGELTNAAVLLFGKEPRQFFNQANIKCIHITSTEVEKPFTSYHIYEGTLFEQVDKAVGFVLDIIKHAVIQQEHTPQFKRPFEIPVFAIEEAIVNAVAHRNYNTKSSVQVMVFLDRVEVWNSGTLPGDLSVEDLRKPHASHPNNPLLAGTLYLANYIQQAGSGTLEMIKQCRAQGAPEPEFVLIRNVEFRTILGRDIFTADVLNKLGLNERQIKAVKYVKEKGRITNREYREVCRTSERTATRDLTHLVSLGVFEQIGITGKGTEYVLRRHKDAKDATKTP